MLKDSYLKDIREQIKLLRKEVHKAIVGLDDLIDSILIAVLGRGHILIEGEPGQAKTRTVNTFAKCINVPSSRVSFTTDVNPSDLIQTIEPTMKPEQPFIYLPGPLLTGAFLLGDELNRTPPKTQSGLLEAMEEGKVTVEGKTHDLRKKHGIHTVFAVQNPIEREATYPLAEALMERFLIKIWTYFLSLREEKIITACKSEALKRDEIEINTIFQPQQLLKLGDTLYKDFYPELHDPDSLIISYIVRVVREFRKLRKEFHKRNEEEADLEYGVSQRGETDLKICSRIYAFLQESEVVLPEHVKAMAPPALRGKFNLTPYARQMLGKDEDILVKEILDKV